MALADIIEKIIADTDAAVERIRRDADEEVSRILSECEEECERITAEAKRAGEKAAADLRKRMTIQVQLEARKALLRERNKLVHEVFAAVRRALYEDADTYKRFIEKKLLENVEKGDEKVIFSGADYERFGENDLKEIVAAVNERLFREDRKGELVLTNERGDFEGGFILKRGRSRIIVTLDAVMAEIRDAYEADVGAILAGGTA